LFDEDALGTYRLIGVTEKHDSPVYVQGDEEHHSATGPTSSSRSFILRDWENDETWFGTRSLECFKKNSCKKTGSAQWLKSGCKQNLISNCKAEDWSIRTGDENKRTWDDGNVFLSFTKGLGTAAIIGIVAGVAVLIAIIAIVAVLVVKKKRKDGNSPSHKVGSQL